MVNYSSDAEMVKVDHDIEQWLGDRADFSDIRELVTTRINEIVKKSGCWEALAAAGALVSSGEMVDKGKLDNPSDLEDIENTWVREILYFDNLGACEPGDPLYGKAKKLRAERTRMLCELTFRVNADAADEAETIFKIGGLQRG